MKLTQLKEQLDRGCSFRAVGSHSPFVFASARGYCYNDAERDNPPLYSWGEFLDCYDDDTEYEQVVGPLYDPDERGNMPRRLHRARCSLIDAKQGMEQAIHMLEYHLHQVDTTLRLLESINADMERLRTQEHW